MRARIHLVLILFLGLLLGFPGSSLAAPPTAKAKALFQQAEVHFSVGEFKKALDLYTEAYKTVPLSGFLYNIAQCHRHLGDCEKATFFFNRYLAQTPSSPYRAQVEEQIKACREKTAIRPPPATIPASIPAPLPSTRPRLAAPDPGPAATQPVRPEAPTGTDSGEGMPSSRWLWTGVAVSGALLLTGVVSGAMAYGMNREFKETSTPPARQEELKSSGQKLAVVSVVSLGVGGAAAIGTGLGYLLWYRPAARRARTRVVVSPLEGGAVVVVGGAF